MTKKSHCCLRTSRAFWTRVEQQGCFFLLYKPWCQGLSLELFCRIHPNPVQRGSWGLPTADKVSGQKGRSSPHLQHCLVQNSLLLSPIISSLNWKTKHFMLHFCSKSCIWLPATRFVFSQHFCKHRTYVDKPSPVSQPVLFQGTPRPVGCGLPFQPPPPLLFSVSTPWAAYEGEKVALDLDPFSTQGRNEQNCIICSNIFSK